MGGLLAGQVALITGAGRGVGRAVTLALADAGAVVAAVSRSHDQLQETAELVASAGGRAIAIVADVTDPQAVDRMAQRAAGELGSVDILVNNAGLARSIGPVWEVEPEEWWRDVETNLRGPFLCARAVLPGMLARRHGRIINVASGFALRPFPYTSAYGSSKAGLLRLTDTLAAELAAAQSGVSVFAVSPGRVQTSMLDYLATSKGGQKWLPELQETPTISPERIMEVVVFLASGHADILSGRFIQMTDDIRELVREGERIRRDNLYSLRLDKLP
jgi:NAD(P)-dependent dehydrogenase (short-subunit alcohol dehydrogenase family)